MLGRFGYDCPAVGFAFDIARALAIMDTQQVPVELPGPDFFIIDFTPEKTAALSLARRLRDLGASVARDIISRGLEESIDYARAQRVRHVLVVGSPRTGVGELLALDLKGGGERTLGKRRIGTTGKGVGPAYVDKAARVGIRMVDLLDEQLFREKLEFNLAQKNRVLRDIYDAETFGVDAILNQYLRYAGWLAPYITDTALLLSKWIDSGYSVLFEGAQGTMLDIDHGTYPFITSSSTTAGGAATGTGIPPTKINGVLGIAKAYTTRVGSGPFPTEMTGPIGELIRTRGNEYGATTGRPRRCGWF